MFNETKNQTGESQQQQNPMPSQDSENLEGQMEKLNNSEKKSSKKVGIIILLIFLGGAVVGSYYFWNDITNFLNLKEEVKEVDCATDTEECPDGSFVKRISPSCEFAECPIIAEMEIDDATKNQIDTSDWQTYRNEEYKISFKHPANNLQIINTGIIFGKLGDFEGNKRPYFQFRATTREEATIPSMLQGEKLTLENVLNRENHGGLMEAFQVNGYNAVRFENLGICDGPEILIFTNELVYDFMKVCDGFSELNKIIDSVIFLQDTDNDGLFDDEEAEYGCDINNPDSDGDGYLDGDEVENGYDPMGEGKL